MVTGDVGKRSAGLLLFRGRGSELEVLLGHMGGPFWRGRQAGAWSIPKGEHESHEPALDAALREFREETGVSAPPGETWDLGEVRQSGGKRVRVWALEGEIDMGAIEPGMFEMEWPKGSGAMRRFPELDRLEWCTMDEAVGRLVVKQRVFLDRLRDKLSE